MNQDLKINSSTVTPIEYKGQRVITFKMIDQVHVRPQGTALRNFTANKDRLVQDKHYFKLNYQEVVKLYEIVLVTESPSRNGLILLTERGYLMLAKSLTDDLAWNVQDQLVDSYFIKLESKSQVPDNFLEAMQLATKTLEQNEVLKLERDTAIKTKAEISDRKTATALNTASQAVKRVNKLEVQLDQSKQYATIKKMQIQTGKTYKWQLLKKAGTELGIKPKRVDDVNYGSVNAYHKDVWMKAYNIKID